MPRLNLISKESLPPSQQHLYEEIAAQRGHVAPPFAALLNSPKIATKVAALGEHLRYTSSTVSAEIREIVTLTTANYFNCQYIYTHHVTSARQAGVRDQVIEVIANGDVPRKLLPKEGVFIQFTRELLKEKSMRDSTFAAVNHLLGANGTIDLITTIGYYAMQCLVVNAVGIELEEGVEPLLLST